MIVETKCKFCRANLKLDVDDDYMAQNDVFKLIPLAACNHCAGLRERRRVLHEHFVHICSALIGTRPDADTLTRVRASLEVATKKYLRLVGEWTGAPDLAWEETMVEPFLAAPKYCGKHLGLFWKMSAQPKLIQ